MKTTETTEKVNGIEVTPEQAQIAREQAAQKEFASVMDRMTKRGLTLEKIKTAKINAKKVVSAMGKKNLANQDIDSAITNLVNDILQRIMILECVDGGHWTLKGYGKTGNKPTDQYAVAEYILDKADSTLSLQ